MLFGRRGGGGEERVSLRDAADVLNASFDRKVGNLEARASAILKSMESARSSFSAACDAFEESTGEPDMEYSRSTSTTFMKEQKASYINALRRVLSSQAGGQYANTYSRHSASLSAVESMIGEVLRTNAKFKQMLQAYPHELGRLKNSFSAMERNSAALKSELAARAKEFGEYKGVSEALQKLAVFKEELESIEAAQREIGTGERGPQADDHAKLSAINESISAKRLELDAARRSVADVRSRLASTLAPLDKAARKYEHGLHSKRAMSYYIEDPLERLSTSASDYDSFYKSVASLKKEVESGTIEVKSKPDVYRAVEFVLSGAAIAMMEEARLLGSRTAPIEEELRELDRIARDLERAKRSSEERSRSISDIARDRERIAEAMQALKRQVEDMFERYYKRRVKLVDV